MNEDIALWIDDDDDKDMDKDENNEKMMRMIQRMTLHNSRLLKPVHKEESSCETLHCCAVQPCGTNIPFNFKFILFNENEKLCVVFIANWGKNPV